MKSLLPSFTIMIGITFNGLAGRAAEKVASFPAAGHGGSLLPPGWLKRMSRRLSRGFRFSEVWLVEKLPPVYDVGRGSTLPPSWN